jgi:GNAT superfamily N-acetyltransferase
MKFMLEELSLSAWPALQTLVYDGWILRFAEGYSNRSNSVNPLYPSTLPIDVKIRHCEECYASRGLSSVFKIVEGGKQREIDGELEAGNYAKIHETFVMTRSLEDIAAPTRHDPTVLFSESFDDEWIDAFCLCSGHDARERPIIARILGNVIVPRIVAAIRENGRIVACGYGAVDRGWVGLFNIAVHKEYRRNGLGQALVASILERARGLGAEQAYLQVVEVNEAARSLYAKIGFADEYRYWYRKKALA